MASRDCGPAGRSGRRRLRGIALEPVAHHVVIELLGPEQARVGLTRDAALVVGERGRQHRRVRTRRPRGCAARTGSRSRCRTAPPAGNPRDRASSWITLAPRAGSRRDSGYARLGADPTGSTALSRRRSRSGGTRPSRPEARVRRAEQPLGVGHVVGEDQRRRLAERGRSEVAQHVAPERRMIERI